MKTIRYVSAILAASSVMLLFTACATITVTAVWKDANYKKGPFNKVVVLALFKELQNRIQIENAVADQLGAGGTKAVPSLSIMNPDQEYKYREMERIFEKERIDGILIIKLKSKDAKQTYVEGENVYAPDLVLSPYYDYFIVHYHLIRTPGYIQEREIIRLESALYANSNDRLVWVAETKTLENYATEDGITSPGSEGRELAKLLFDKLRENGLIK